MSTLISQDYAVVVPAYGRDYPSAADAANAFLSGKDFKYQGLLNGYIVSAYCSVRDFAPGTKVSIRFHRGLAKTVVEVPRA